MTAALDTFAKVRALHDRTDSPGEKAAAAGRMEALARAAGMTTAEAVSRLDGATARPASGVDWGAFAEAFWQAGAASAAADAPEAPSPRHGLPIYDPSKVEPWWSVATNVLGLDWIIPKACGGRFLTKAERARLKTFERYALVTNADADWIETALARCMAAREVWRERNRKSETHPDRKATEGDIEKAAAKRREASKLDTSPSPPPQSPFEKLFNSPKARAARAARERRDAERQAAILAEVGSEDAVWAEAEREIALERACRPVMACKPIIDGEMDTLSGWDGGRLDKMPPAVREAVSGAYPLPATVREAWAEFSTWEKLADDQCAFWSDYSPDVRTRARIVILEHMLDTMPAGDMQDLRARLAWMQHVLDLGFSRDIHEDQACLTALRADIERMGARLRDQDAGAVQTGRQAGGGETPPRSTPGAEPIPATVQTGHRPSTRAERRSVARALLAEGLTDREIARRVGISPTTVGSLRRVAS